MAPSPPGLDPDQLLQLEDFLKDWLKHCGRTQADLRRALRASSIRMPVLLEELLRVHNRDGLAGLAQRLCEIEALWQGEEAGARGDGRLPPALNDSFGQLDLLLEEIRQIAPDSPK